MLDKVEIKSLVIFDTLMQERSQRRAASRLGCDPSNINYHIGRLRDITGDVLFERSNGKTLPTRRAVEIHNSVKVALNALNMEFEAEQDFDYLHATDHFTLMVNDVFAKTVVPAILDSVNDLGLKITFGVEVFSEFRSEALRTQQKRMLLTSLKEGLVDLVISSMDDMTENDNIKRQKLYEEPCVHVESITRQCLADVDGVGAPTLHAGSDLASGANYVGSDVISGEVVADTLFSAAVPRSLQGDHLVKKGGQHDDDRRLEMFQYWHLNDYKKSSQQWLRQFVLKHCREVFG